MIGSRKMKPWQRQSPLGQQLIHVQDDVIKCSLGLDQVRVITLMLDRSRHILFPLHQFDWGSSNDVYVVSGTR